MGAKNSISHRPTPCCQGAPAVPSDVRACAADLAPVCRALGDATRLQIAALLARAEGYLCACEIEAHFALAQPTISHHLQVLRKAGLVETERRGTWIHYRLRSEAAQAMRSLAVLVCGTRNQGDIP